MNDEEKSDAKGLVTKMVESGLATLPEPTPSLAIAAPTTVAAPVADIEVTAENADEMAQCQNAMIAWAKAKVQELTRQWHELKEAYEHAVKRKWKSDTLKRHAGIAEKRAEFFNRMLTALIHGYQIVPSFPVTAFAIRTTKDKPLKMWTTAWNKNHTQIPETLEAGEGEYKNPFPLVHQRTVAERTQTTAEIVNYWAEAWKDVEFPFSMSKIKIMEATTRAMALKIFDDFAILPGYAPGEGTRPPKGDPIIVARLKDPRPTGPYNPPRYITFIVAWHLDTKTL